MANETTGSGTAMKKLRAVDLFCGAGGMSTGAVQSGFVRVVLAVNHSRVAIRSHQGNHPGTRHICAEMEHLDPADDRTLPDVDLVMAGKEIIVLNRDEAHLWRTMDLLGIADIGFRMLDVDELGSAMGLPASYYLHGSKAEQIKQIGNMVCVGVMRAICRAIGEAGGVAA